MIEKLHTTDGHILAYHKTIHPHTAPPPPTIVFLGGLMSDMYGTKALALDEYCNKQHYNFIRFDYVGHGESSGSFTDGTISLWKNNVLAVIDELTEGPLLLIGSSLGGWLMLLAAKERPDRVKGLLGIAAAPDFTEELMWNVFSDDVKRELEEHSIYHMPSDYSDCPYPITYDLIKDGRNNLVLNAPISLDCPIRLLHGMKDDDVPHSISLRIAEQSRSDNIRVILDKDGDHKMSSPRMITLLYQALDSLVIDFVNTTY